MSSATPEQLSENVIVRAGAGAGKTRRLTTQVIDTARAFQAREGRFPRIVVTTFTRKATQELRERLMLWALKEAPDMIEFVNSHSHLIVSTIHGVLDIYMKRYGGNVGIDPGFKITGSIETTRLARQVLRLLLVERSEWQELLEAFGFNRLVELMLRYNEIHLRAPEAKPHDLKSFSELFSQMAKGLSDEITELAAHIEAEASKDDWRAMAADLKSIANLLRKGDWLETRDEVLAKIGSFKAARYNSKNPPVSEETNAKAKLLVAKIRELEDDPYEPAVWGEFVSQFSLFESLGLEFSEKFAKSKIDAGSIEISDLELLAMDCLRKFPETAEAFSQEWDYWLIDEYQDTSPFQVELLRRLSGARPTFIVGDPQQSIYLFRGARMEVFSKTEREIVESGGRKDLLVKNYRSRPELLLFFNDLFGKLAIPFHPMEANLLADQKADSSRVVAEFFTIPALSDDSDDAKDSDPELLALVRRVQDLLAQGADPADICVLARTNQTLLDVAGWLGKYRLPTHVHAASGFYSRRETLDALALLKFLVNPHDNINTVQLLRSPWFRISDESLTRWILASKSGSHWERISAGSQRENGTGQDDSTAERVRSWLERRSELGITGVFRRALTESGFIDLSHFHDMSGRRESNVWKLLAKLSQEEAKPGFNYLDFISHSEIDMREGSGNEESDAIAVVEPDRINLMTVHLSKGLQFKHVLLPRMGQAPRLTKWENFTFDEDRKQWAFRIPRGENLEMTASLAEKVWLSSFQKHELQEHARVFYVALTRAIETVTLSWMGEADTNSWADMLRWDLSEGLHQRESYGYRVSSHIEAPLENQARVEALDAARAPWRLQSGAEAKPKRLKENVSVSQLLDRSAYAHQSHALLSIPNRLKLASQGTAVHRLMEALKSPTGENVHGLIKRWFPEKEDQVIQCVEYVVGLEEPPLARIIQEGFVEWGFAFIENGILIEGQIDLWGRVEENGVATVWVIDYKTGSPEGKEKAFHQLALYALALRKAGEVKVGDVVRLAAVYPFAEKVFLQDEPTREFYRERFNL